MSKRRSFPRHRRVSSVAPSHPSSLQRAVKETQNDEALIAQGKFNTIRLRLLEACQLWPEEPRFAWLLGLGEWNLGHDDMAGGYLQTAARLNPDWALGQSTLGQWYLKQGMAEPAMQATAQAMKAAPDHPQVIETRAWACQAAGELDDAWQLLQRLMARGTVLPSVIRLYARLAPRYHQTEQALTLLIRALSIPEIPPNEHGSLCMSAAEILDRLGRYDEAFALASRGNSIGAMRHLPYNAAAVHHVYAKMIAYFTQQRVASLAKASGGSDKPVLIVGMPRSGTSLVEQILASHPDIHGAGELDFMPRTFYGTLQMLSANEQEFPACLDRLSVEQANGMAEIYWMPLSAMAPQAARITDKMPLNFLYLGLASLLLPGVKVIHCRRDPLDTCLSCYLTEFTTRGEFKYNLSHLGLYYKEYERLMTHWKTALELPILDVNYEELIADPERQSRRMVEFIGLPWNEQCLRFYQTKRPVATASALQVRQPIYNSSRQRWRNYAKHLGPLQAALGILRVP